MGDNQYGENPHSYAFNNEDFWCAFFFDFLWFFNFLCTFFLHFLLLPIVKVDISDIAIR